MDQSVYHSLSQFIASQILKQPQRQIAPDETIISSGLIDSFSLVDLALFVEQSLGVHIDDTELNADSFDSLEQLVALIEERR